MKKSVYMLSTACAICCLTIISIAAQAKDSEAPSSFLSVAQETPVTASDPAAPAVAPMPDEVDEAAVDPCSAYMESGYEAYQTCQDRVMRIEAMQKAKENRKRRREEAKAAKKAAKKSSVIQSPGQNPVLNSTYGSGANTGGITNNGGNGGNTPNNVNSPAGNTSNTGSTSTVPN